MAAIRCIDVADSAQFVAGLRNRGGRSFAASLIELLRKASCRPPFWEKQRWRSPELQMHLLLQNNQCAFPAPPGNDHEFLFLCAAQKDSFATSEGKRWGYGCSVDACGGSIVDWSTTAYALFHCMDQRVAPPKCLRQMPVVLRSEAAPRFGQWVLTRRTWKWWCRCVAQREHSFCPVMLLCCWCETQPFRDRRFCWQGQCHHCLDHRGWATYPLLWPIRKASLRVCTCLQGTGNRPCLVSDDQTNCEFVYVWGGHQARLLLRRTMIGAQSVVKTMDLLVGNLTAAVVIQGNHCHSTFAH